MLSFVLNFKDYQKSDAGDYCNARDNEKAFHHPSSLSSGVMKYARMPHRSIREDSPQPGNCAVLPWLCPGERPGSLTIGGSGLHRGISRGQRGVSIIAAIFIMTILAFMGVMFVSLIGTENITAVNDLQATKALYIAEGGVERVLRFLADGNICSQITASFSAATTLGDGTFIATGAQYRPTPLARLPNNIDDLTTSIQTNTANLLGAGYAPSGRITIQDPPAAAEVIEYASIAGDTFTNCLRGADGTTARTHSANRRIVQNQCDIIAAGTIAGFVNVQRLAQVSVWY